MKRSGGVAAGRRGATVPSAVRCFVPRSSREESERFPEGDSLDDSHHSHDSVDGDEEDDENDENKAFGSGFDGLAGHGRKGGLIEGGRGKVH